MSAWRSMVFVALPFVAGAILIALLSAVLATPR
jgi:cell division protein FtsX